MMSLEQAIALIESIGGMARQPARSTAVAIFQDGAKDKDFVSAVQAIRDANIQVIEIASREAFNDDDID